MMLGKQTMWVGGLALALASVGALAHGQSAAAQQSVPNAPQPGVPNAPQPQMLPTLNTITPVAPALPAADRSTSAANANDASDDAAPGNAQTDSTPKAQTSQEQDEAQPQTGPPPVSARSEENVLRVNVQYHSIPFTVKDSKGHLVPGLTYRDVRVYENGLRQHVAFFTADPYPLSVALVIDQSVTYDTMEKINDSLAALQGAFTPYDEVAVFTYNNGVNERTAFTGAQSPRLSAVLEQSKGTGREPLMGMTGPLSQGSIINNQQIDGVADPGHQAGSIQLTAPREFHTLNDAVLAAAQATVATSPNRRRIVYVISDGKEYGSTVNQKQVTKYLLTNNVAVWATLVGDSAIKGFGFLDRVHLPYTMRDDVLPKYAAATGGQVDPEFRPKGIEESFAQITDEVRAQYTVGYYTHESPFNESFRRTEIRIERPGLTIISKPGYYPSAADNARGFRPAAASTSAPATAPTTAPATPQ